MGLRYRRSWIDENLDGSIRTDLEPAERSVWSDLLDLCGKSRKWGVIQMSQGIPYTIEDFAHRFHTPIEIVKSTIDKCLIEGRLSKDGHGALVVTNWDKYQTKPVDWEDWLADPISGKRKRTAKRDNIPMSPEDKEAASQAAAARLGYLEPEASQRGIGHREIDDTAKKHNKRLLQQEILRPS